MQTDFCASFLQGLMPEELLTVDQWADKYRYLSTESSSEPGLWRTDRVPFMREPMQRLSYYDPAEIVVFCKGAQVSGTELGYNLIGYCIDIAPCPILHVMPTVDLAKRNSKSRLSPMLAATPRLNDKIPPARSRDSGNTTMVKEYPGGIYITAGANSASALRSMPAKVLILDEVDAYPLDLDGEGSPIDLAMARTRNFPNKKVYMLSTPTVENISVIDREFKNSCQRYWHVPCPDCGTAQKLIWAGLKWDPGKPETARYECQHCGYLTHERFKTKMLAAGEWISDKPELENSRRWGYHLNSLYSPYGWYSWEQAAREWEEAQDDKTQSKLKTFINTVLAETWKETGERPEWEILMNRSESYARNEPPTPVVFLTSGVDIQKDRIELEIVGWARGKKAYSVDYRILMGDTSQPDVWAELSKITSETWKREDGKELSLRLMCIDAQYNTQYVYDFCRKHDASRVIPVRGVDRQNVLVSSPRVVDTNSRGKKMGHVKVWGVGVSLGKSELYSLLKLNKGEDGNAPDGYCYFPAYDAHYFKGLTAEQLQFSVDRKGYRKYEWVKLFDRNEPLDCRNYARAAASIVGIDVFTDAHWTNLENGPAPRKKRKIDDDIWK